MVMFSEVSFFENDCIHLVQRHLPSENGNTKWTVSLLNSLLALQNANNRPKRKPIHLFPNGSTYTVLGVLSGTTTVVSLSSVNIRDFSQFFHSF